MNNINQCKSVQKKTNLNIQCPNKCKNNEILCGIHLKSKNKVFFDEKIIFNNIIKVSDINDVNINDIDCDINSVDKNINKNLDKNLNNKVIYSIKDLFDKILNNDNLNVYSIRTSIKMSYLNKFIDTKLSKHLLIKELKNIIIKERFYLANQNYIILIQKNFRRWLIYRKKLCYNDTDILTFNSKYVIPEKYFYIFNDSTTKKKYAYDIRTLIEIINSNYPSCPYTFRIFTDEEKNKINLYKNKIILQGINIEIEKKVLTEEEETNMKIKDVFYQINMLDNYTNSIWFKNLNIYQLYDLYLIMEDIWNYRSNMTTESKKKIVKGGILFTYPKMMIKSIKSKIKLQNIILNDFSRLITEGIDREEMKLGAILILTGLVEVSHEASDALPHLIQVL